ncbi:N-6 DNA methylase [Vibrio sp. 10N.247.310.34]|uniref:N-6 DNA methylase n=1 Tax=Vibrio sp. 10N.247.310.34 TaxID=3229982 RepID=UPI00354CB9A1
MNYQIERNPALQFSNATSDAMRKLGFSKQGLMYQSVWDITDNLMSYLKYDGDELTLPENLVIWRSLWEELESNTKIGDDHFANINQEGSKRGRSYGSEFFTPALHSDIMCNVAVDSLMCLSKKLQKDERLKILEPSCGTGAILMRFIKAAYHKCPELLPRMDFIVNDLNRSSTDAVSMNFMLQQLVGVPLTDLTIHNGDALKLLPMYEGQIHCVIGNPPFHKVSSNNYPAGMTLPCFYNKPLEYLYANGGLKIDSPTFKDVDGKKLSKLKYNSTVPLDIAITEMPIRLLKPLGICSLVIPDGILANSKSKAFRQGLIDGAHNDSPINLLSNMSLPSTTFLHSETSVKTSILTISKNVAVDSVMMAVIEDLGWDSRTKALREDDITKGNIDKLLSELKKTYAHCVQKTLCDETLLTTSGLDNRYLEATKPVLLTASVPVFESGRCKPAELININPHQDNIDLAMSVNSI